MFSAEALSDVPIEIHPWVNVIPCANRFQTILSRFPLVFRVADTVKHRQFADMTSVGHVLLARVGLRWQQAVRIPKEQDSNTRDYQAYTYLIVHHPPQIWSRQLRDARHYRFGCKAFTGHCQ